MRMKKWISLVLLMSFLISPMSALAEGGNMAVVDAAANENTWEYSEFIAEPEGTQPLNTNGILLKTNVLGDTKGLQYKFVWQKDNWKKWGVIQDFSDESQSVWKPEETGNYILYADVKDNTGKVATKTLSYKVTEILWDSEGAEIFPLYAQHPGEMIQIQAKASGNTKGLQYKFVWQKDNWEEWAVIQEFSEKSSVDFSLKEVGKYKIYVDMKDTAGKIKSTIIDYEIKTDIWKFEGITAKLATPQEKYVEPITLSANVSGETNNLQYKFVWQKNNWKEWAVIKEFSASPSVEWSPKDVGKYTIYVDVKDADGNMETKTMNYEITPVKWNADGVESVPVSVQKKGENVFIKALASGNTKGLQYKFVWEKDNWSDWGVIAPFSEKNEAEWKTPKKAGEYNLYVDIKDRDGEIRTLKTSYYLATQIWEHEGVVINEGVPEQIYRTIPVEAKVSGETGNLQYKFVWEKDNWSKWGVIKDYSSDSVAEWYPKEPGTYKIYSDIKDVDGRKQTVIQEYTVLDAPWKVDAIKVESEGSYFVGDSTDVEVITSGENEGLQYKFVVKYGNDWSDRKVVQDFSMNNKITVDIKKAGNYTIYVDIKDKDGAVFDPITKVLTGHTYTSASASPDKVTVGRNTVLAANLSGNVKGAKYKYVWMKNNWKEWGVISENNPNSQIEWSSNTLGTYTVYIDVELNGIIQSKTVVVNVVKEKNGWYYEDGYKFYYKNNVKLRDVSNIIGKQSSYVIKVNKQRNTVTVYAKDGNNGYIIPVKAFICSVGTGTPLGTFYTPAKYRWHELMGPSWGQWCTRITGGILFHSVFYNSYNNNMNLSVSAYNKLGTTASHGCVRLSAGDAKWIYDNCGLQTKVVIYNSAYEGPLGKPTAYKLNSGHKWDPTDPTARWKCVQKGCH